MLLKVVSIVAPQLTFYMQEKTEKDKKAARLKDMEARRVAALQKKAEEEKARQQEAERRRRAEEERRKVQREELAANRSVKLGKSQVSIAHEVRRRALTSTFAVATTRGSETQETAYDRDCREEARAQATAVEVGDVNDVDHGLVN